MSAELEVRLAGRTVRLRAGEAALASAGALYRDAPDGVLEAIGTEIAKGTPWREAARLHLEASNPWLLRVVTERSRTLWLEQHPIPGGCRVLDVGAGWGQWAVPAAASADVVALEPNPARLAVMRAIAAQEGRAGRMRFVGASLEDVEFPQARFERVFCIGVLEWVPRFREGVEPLVAQAGFLRRLRGLLAPDGECLIGIENRLGLKYLLGAPDDHTGLAGISVLEAPLAAQRHRDATGERLRVFTHTMEEYRGMLGASGFGAVEFFGAFPDYKVPQVILPVADGSVDRHCLGGPFIPEHNGSNGEPLDFQDALESHYRSLGAMNVARAFAPSYFIRAMP